jgi:hypothetical protein
MHRHVNMRRALPACAGRALCGFRQLPGGFVTDYAAEISAGAMSTIPVSLIRFVTPVPSKSVAR